jgi:16S rRNA (guanine(527)-N(7))-methyltransferase RsmG
MTIESPGVPSATAIQRAAGEFSLVVNGHQIQHIQQYTEVLLAWNDKVNLTAIRDPLEILYRHFCESMYGATVLPVEKCRLADVGSGAGFPGLALKIVRPDLEVFLVESNVKKATFIAEVIRELGLTDARVLVSRFEELGEEVAPLDFVCSRALGDFPRFLEWAGSPQVLARNVLLWLGRRDLDDVKAVRGWEWEVPIPMPHSLQRVLLRGTPNAAEATDAGAAKSS